MVKRLRRSPLTAESGVRFPLGSPNTSNRLVLPVFIFIKVYMIKIIKKFEIFFYFACFLFL